LGVQAQRGEQEDGGEMLSHGWILRAPAPPVNALFRDKRRMRCYSRGMKRTMLAACAALSLCALAWSQTVPYTASENYYNGLYLYAGDSPVYGGPFNVVAGPADGYAFTVSWERQSGEVEYEDVTPYVPTFRWFTAKGAMLTVTAAPFPMRAGGFSSGRALLLAADREALYGYMGTDGKWAIQPRFAEAWDFKDGYAAAREPGGRWGVIDASGKWAVSPAYARVIMMRYGFFIAGFTLEEDPWRLYDSRTGKRVFSWDAAFDEFSVLEYADAPTTVGGKVRYPLVVEGPDQSLWGVDGIKLLDSSQLPGRQWDYKVADGKLVFITQSQGADGVVTYSLHRYDPVARTMAPPVASASFPSWWYGARESLGGYRVEADRHTWWFDAYASDYISIISPAGKVVSKGVFGGLSSVRGDVGVVLVGSKGSWWGDGPRTSSVPPSLGAYGLFNLATGKFLVPPACSQIVHAGGTQWYVWPHGQTAYLFDTATGKRVRNVAYNSVFWFSGSFVCTSANVAYRDEAGTKLSILGYINADNVRVRSGPATTYDIVTELDRGTLIRVKSFKPEVETIGSWTGMWAEVDVLGKDSEVLASGSVFSQFIDLVGEYQQ